LGDYVAICDRDLSCGVLLQRMAFLHEKAVVVIEEKLWYVTTRQELMTATGLTKFRYDTALSALKAKGFIEVTSIPFNNVLRNTAFRVTETCRCAIVAQVKGSKPGNHSPGIQATDSPDVQATDSLTHQTIKKKIISYKISDYSSYPGSQSETGKVSSGSLEKIWRDSMIAAYPDHFHVAWGKRLQSTAKNLMKKIGTKEAGEVIVACLSEWSAFAEFTAKSTKLKLPERPDLYSVMLHAEPAVNFTKSRATKGIDTFTLKKLSDL
jgi:hypothetical protein